MKKWIFRLFLLGLVVLASIIWFNTNRFTSRQLIVDPIKKVELSDSLLTRFAAALQIPTVSAPGKVDTAAFRELDTLLLSQFKLVHQKLEFERVNEFSRIYRWPGINAQLDPILLIAHLDVVPATDTDLWEQAPFSGAIKDGFIWGRGALDDKLSAWGLLEAVEQLLKSNFEPNRTIYIAFGHDEEISGEKGAGAIAKKFEEEGLHFAFVLDEGLVILENALDGLESPVAMVGIAEKGICNLNLIVEESSGGHAMMPPSETVVGILANAIANLEANPFTPKIDGAVSQFFDYIGPEMSGVQKIAMANRWISSGLLIDKLGKDPAASALLRTTIAPTMVRAGVRSNVLPSRATAKVNFRILPGETVEGVIAHCKSVIDDPRVKIQLDTSISFNNPSAVSDVNALGFQLIQRTILEVYPEVVVAPSMVIGYTDSRQYKSVVDQTYRFCPVVLDRSDLGRIHGANERIAVHAYLDIVRFYIQLMRQGGAG